MNHDTLRSLDRILDRMERRSQRPRRGISTAPLVMGVGLVMGNLLLTRLVPVIWESCLPRGLEQASSLRGWPGMVWRLALFCHSYQQSVWVVIGAAVVASLVISVLLRPLRALVWLSAVGVIVADAAILVITLMASLSMTVAGAGF